MMSVLDMVMGEIEERKKERKNGDMGEKKKKGLQRGCRLQVR